MANPTIPAPFHLGSYLGEQAASGLRDSLDRHFEMRTLRNAFDELGSEATPQQKFQAMLTAPISNETKKLGMQYFKETLANQPTFGSSDKLLSEIGKRVPGVEAKLGTLTPQQRQSLSSEILRRGGNEQAVYSLLQDLYNGTPIDQFGQPSSQSQSQPSTDFQNQPQQASEEPASIAEAFKRFTSNPGQVQKRSWDQMNALQKYANAAERGLRAESLAGAIGGNELSDKEKQELAQLGIGGEVASNLGAFLGDLPFFAGLGPMAGILTTGIGKSIANSIWKEARSDKDLTPERLGQITNKVLQDSSRAAIEGTLFKRIPVVGPFLKRIPALQKPLESATADGLLKLAETGAIMGVVGPATEGRLPNREDMGRGIALALGFEATRIPRSIANKLADIATENHLPPDRMAELIRTNADPKVLTGKNASEVNSELTKIRKAAKVEGAARPGIDRAEAMQNEGRQQPQEESSIADQMAARVRQAQDQPGGMIHRQRAQKTAQNAPKIDSRTKNAQTPSEQPKNMVQSGEMADRAVMEQLANRARPMTPEQPNRIPAPKPIAEMEPLAREQQVGTMRGERPFIPEGETLPRPNEKIETTQSREVKAAELKKTLTGIRDDIRELNRLQKERLSSSQAEREAIDRQLKEARERIEAAKKTARRQQKEIQTGRERLSDEKINEMVANTRRKIIEEAGRQLSDAEVARNLKKKSETESKVKMAKALNKKVDRLPADYSDSFLRVKQGYADAFTKMRDAATRELDMLKGDDTPEGAQERRVNQKIHDAADQLVKEAQADITIHRHKKGQEITQETARKEAQLKQREKTTAKTEKLTPKKLNEFRRHAEEYERSKTAGNLNKLAETAGMQPSQVKEAIETGRDEGKKLVERLIEPLKSQPAIGSAKEPSFDERRAAVREKLSPNQKPGTSKVQVGSNLGDAMQKTQEAANKPSTGPKKFSMKALQDNAKKLFSDLSKGRLKDVWENPLGKALALQAALAAVQEAVLPALGIDKRLPYGSALIALAGRNPYHRIVAGLIAISKFAAGQINEKQLIEQYKKAIQASDFPRIAELEEQMTRRQLEKSAL